jgi:hypothetical protein
VYTTTHHDDLHKLLVERWAVLDQNPAPLYRVLTKRLVETANPMAICGLDVSKDWQFAIPPLERAPGYRPASSRMLWPTIELTDGTSLAPVRAIEGGTVYQVCVYTYVYMIYIYYVIYM